MLSFKGCINIFKWLKYTSLITVNFMLLFWFICTKYNSYLLCSRGCKFYQQDISFCQFLVYKNFTEYRIFMLIIFTSNVYYK